MAQLVIFGASRGLGAAFSIGLPTPGDRVWLISRSEPDSLSRHDGVERRWIRADLSKPAEAAALIAEALGDEPVDLALYNAGIWEGNAFSETYALSDVPVEETINIIHVNLTSAILAVQTLLPNLHRSGRAKVILIGSTSGLENAGVPEAAYTASKFGLRGAAHALREHLRRDGIPVTCINPGDLGVEIPYDEGVEKVLTTYRGTRIPAHDLVALVRCLMSLSRASCVKEIDMPAMTDRTA